MSTSTPSPPLLTPATSASLRLDTLHFLIHGTSPSPSSSSITKPALVRLADTLSSLTALQRTAGKPLTHFLDDWDRNASLLHPLSAETEGERGGSWDAHEQAAYLLSQYPELIAASKELERIEQLVEKRNVLDGDASRRLSRATTDTTRLANLRAQDRKDAAKAKEVNDRVIALVHSWSSYTSTLSQAFSAIDSELLTLERQVAALERTSASDADT